MHFLFLIQDLQLWSELAEDTGVMKSFRVFLILGILLSGVACTKATPEFDLLDENAIPQPKFSGSTVKSITTSSSGVTFLISGECDPKIRSISAMAVGQSSSFSDLGSLISGTAAVECSSKGTFSFQLKSLSDIFANVKMGETYEIQLRGVTSAGSSKPSYIRISYQSPTGNPYVTIAAGGIHGGAEVANKASGAGFKADIFVRHMGKTFPGAAQNPSNAEFSARIGVTSR